MNPDQYSKEVYIKDISSSVILFKHFCLDNLNLKGRQILDSIDVVEFVRSVFNSLLEPLITRRQEMSPILVQAIIDKLLYETAHTGISHTQAYNLVARTEAFVLRDIIDLVPHIDNDDFYVDSVTFGQNNTMYINAYRLKDTCVSHTGYKTR